MVEFGQLEETEVKFYKTLLRSILVDNSEEIVTAIFARLAPLPALKQFRTELILYIKHFLGQPASTSTAEGREELLTTRIKLAEQAMKAHGHVFWTFLFKLVVDKNGIITVYWYFFFFIVIVLQGLPPSYKF